MGECTGDASGGFTKTHSRKSRGSCLLVRRETYLFTLLVTAEEAVTTGSLAPTAQFSVVSSSSQKQSWKGGKCSVACWSW